MAELTEQGKQEIFGTIIGQMYARRDEQYISEWHIVANNRVMLPPHEHEGHLIAVCGDRVDPGQKLDLYDLTGQEELQRLKDDRKHTICEECGDGTEKICRW